MLLGKKILLGVTGSIAAYKTLLLTRLLVTQGAEVKVIMTEAATSFVSALSFSTLSKNEVLSQLSTDSNWANHVMLGRWADLMIIAPLSANTLAKMAGGHCDNLLLAVYLSATCPVMLAPAMDEDMWLHPAVRNNIDKLVSFGNEVLPVGDGELASGLVGKGRMAEPADIMNFIQQHFSKTQALKGKKVLVSAGPTYEPIDPVRFIGNRSSGKMGICIAEEMANQGAEVTLILGPSSIVPNKLVKVIDVDTAEEMYNSCMEAFGEADITIMCAAVADYKVEVPAVKKIKKTEDLLSLTLTRTRDILRELGQRKKSHQFLCGFALETNDGEQHAIAKIEKKDLDMIVLNSLSDAEAGFGFDTNKITIFDRRKNKYSFPNKSKTEVAKDIVTSILNFLNA